MQPTEKAKTIDDMLTAIMGKSRVETVETRGCMVCVNPLLDFRDEVSVREYRISGMCQSCQDDFFDG